jgi:hypothetical protein
MKIFNYFFGILLTVILSNIGWGQVDLPSEEINEKESEFEKKVRSKRVSIFVDDEEDSLLAKEYDKHDGKFGTGVDFGFNLLLTNSFNRDFTNSPQWKNEVGASYYWNVNLIDHKLIIKENKLGFTTGFGLNFSNYQFQNRYALTEKIDAASNEVYPSFKLDTINYETNKIRTAYIQVPFLVEYTPTSKVWILAGVIAGYNISTYYQQEFSQGNATIIRSYKGKFGINRFKLDGTIQAGYGAWGVFATYGFTNLMNTNLVPELHPFSFGFRVCI